LDQFGIGHGEVLSAFKVCLLPLTPLSGTNDRSDKLMLKWRLSARDDARAPASNSAAMLECAVLTCVLQIIFVLHLIIAFCLLSGQRKPVI